ncbi:hypothetical protein M231_03437 [Tremella mesenterica]|uniref:Uncharacterized protein n=1 Tax=Tremella mesenterica TaxID=5217 RepID=A0A4Q1BNC5_TREME|nr:uncharacterized protein TREMEDRAFT_61023 [Tremella mesenterica DSM 1558]EIW70521.1 hypothetical protein TREMEDRAFT_61023 [Tremella mesenterica DSM 1558]RXK39358.1 hypothetical protein M231_03437 [Tremella mesenterica]
MDSQPNGTSANTAHSSASASGAHNSSQSGTSNSNSLSGEKLDEAVTYMAGYLGKGDQVVPSDIEYQMELALAAAGPESEAKTHSIQSNISPSTGNPGSQSSKQGH